MRYYRHGRQYHRRGNLSLKTNKSKAAERFVEEEREGELEETNNVDIPQEVTIADKLTAEEIKQVNDGTVDSQDEDRKVAKFTRVPVIAFSDGDVKSILMLHELKQNDKLDVLTVIEDKRLFKDPNRVITQKMKVEKEKGNIYKDIYVPFSNDDLGKANSKLLKDVAEINYILKNDLNLDAKVYSYFGEREDREIIKTAGLQGKESKEL